jgi:aminomethyltransferase
MSQRNSKMNKNTALYQSHLKLGAKMTPFSGYNMPVWYSTLKDEHYAVRNHAGIFDISHMCTLIFSGKTAFADIQKLTCNSLEKIKTNKMIYSMILNENGNILDDIMVGQNEDGKIIMIVNAGNADKIMAWITPKLSPETTMITMRDTHSLLAIQGPEAIQKASEGLSLELKNIPKFGIETHSNYLVMRTGYTGEDGLEILLPNSEVEKVWSTMIQVGITPCGLGARDTLRLEAGLPLYGQEFSEESNPLMTRYTWVVKWDHEYIGKKALEKIKEAGNEYKTIGLQMNERVIPRTGYKIVEGGHITSGTLSPTLDKPIAMAIVKTNATIGDTLTIEIRGKFYSATVVAIPFL